MRTLHNRSRPKVFEFFRKSGYVRQQAANSNVVPFPASRLASRFLELDDAPLAGERRLPLGICLIIWAGLAIIGWSALDALARLI